MKVGHLCNQSEQFDSDEDGLTIEEVYRGLDPNQSDSDEDGLSDSDELNTGDQSTDPDSDGDGLNDGEEVSVYTRPSQ